MILRNEVTPMRAVKTCVQSFRHHAPIFSVVTEDFTLPVHT